MTQLISNITWKSEQRFRKTLSYMVFTAWLNLNSSWNLTDPVSWDLKKAMPHTWTALKINKLVRGRILSSDLNIFFKKQVQPLPLPVIPNLMSSDFK